MSLRWDEVSFVIASTYRTTVLKRLMSGPAPPSMIADDTRITPSHVSRALNELREHGLVELLVAEDRKKGRVYGITDYGTEVWETIETQQLVSVTSNDRSQA
jgi:DNA-binding MarR family transcriptional regulator